MKETKMNLRDFVKTHTKKIYTNYYSSNHSYLHPDLDSMAAKAREEGRDCFYCEPVDPAHEYWKLRECEPKYVYQIFAKLTEEEYKTLMQEE